MSETHPLVFLRRRQRYLVLTHLRSSSSVSDRGDGGSPREERCPSSWKMTIWLVHVLPACTFFKVPNDRVGRTWGARAAACAVVSDNTMVKFVEVRDRRRPLVRGWCAPSSAAFAPVRKRSNSNSRGEECTGEDAMSTHFADGAILFKSCATCPVGHATLRPQRRCH